MRPCIYPRLSPPCIGEQANGTDSERDEGGGLRRGRQQEAVVLPGLNTIANDLAVVVDAVGIVESPA